MAPCNRAIFEGLERPALRIGVCMPEFALGVWSEDFFRGRVLILTSPGEAGRALNMLCLGDFFGFLRSDTLIRMSWARLPEV